MNNVVFKTLMLKGEQGATIVRIERIAIEGANDVMRIYLSDGTTVDFEVQNTLDDDHVKSIIAEVTDNALSGTSEDPVQNKVITNRIAELQTGINSKVGAWTYLSKETKPDRSSLSAVDVSSVFDTAREFLVTLYVTTSTAGAYQSSISVLIPNVLPADDPAPSNKRDFINGYYFDSNYNGCLYVRYNYTDKIISIVPSFTEVTGSSDAGGTLTVYYR